MKTVSRILIGLCVVGGAILLVLATLGASRLGWNPGDGEDTQPTAPVQLPPSPVSVKKVELETVEITDSYPGIIEPFERFSLGFEISGRVIALGVNKSGDPLDDGDRVEKGQVLAKLDERVLRARVKEIEAQIRETKARQIDAGARQAQAASDWARLQEVLEENPEAITDAARDQAEMDLKVADSQLEVMAAQTAMLDAELAIANKAMEDAELICPVSGVISRRLVNAGESVNANQRVFEVILVDDVLLVVGVPEAYVGAIHRGQPVQVEMLARDRFGRVRPRHQGSVYRVGQTANETTGLFGVEVLIDNAEGLLRPGQIGRGHIVIDRVEGYRVPCSAAIRRQDFTLIFAVDESNLAHAVVLENRIEQGEDFVIATLPEDRRSIVVRGQHRLVDGQPVKIVESSLTPAP